MKTSFTDRSFACTVFAAFLTFLLPSTILSHVALAQTPANQVTESETTEDGATDLEIDGQPPSVSAPLTSPTSREEVEIDVHQRGSSWGQQEGELQQEQEQEEEYSLPDAPPPGSVTPQQDSPDQIEVPL